MHLNNNLRKLVVFLNYTEFANSLRTMPSIEGVITDKKGGLKKYKWEVLHKLPVRTM